MYVAYWLKPQQIKEVTYIDPILRKRTLTQWVETLPMLTQQDCGRESSVSCQIYVSFTIILNLQSCGQSPGVLFQVKQSSTNKRNVSDYYLKQKDGQSINALLRVVLVVKNPSANAGTWDVGLVPGLGRCPWKEHGNNASVLAWRSPQTEEAGRLRSIALHRVGHDWSDLAPTKCFRAVHRN